MATKTEMCRQFLITFAALDLLHVDRWTYMMKLLSEFLHLFVLNASENVKQKKKEGNKYRRAKKINEEEFCVNVLDLNCRNKCIMRMNELRGRQKALRDVIIPNNVSF
jgi:hypothetical protein